MDGHDAGVNPAAVLELRQGGIRLLFHEFLESLQLPAGELRRPSATVGLGRNCAPFPPPLQEATDPRRTDPEKLGNMLAPTTLLIAGPHDPFPQIH